MALFVFLLILKTAASFTKDVSALILHTSYCHLKVFGPHPEYNTIIYTINVWLVSTLWKGC